MGRPIEETSTLVPKAQISLARTNNDGSNYDARRIRARHYAVPSDDGSSLAGVSTVFAFTDFPQIVVPDCVIISFQLSV
jgi:hypothetical protein